MNIVANMTRQALTGECVGDTLLLGRHGGAYCNRYRIVSIVDGVASLQKVEARSVRNTDGTFSTVYEAAK